MSSKSTKGKDLKLLSSLNHQAPSIPIRSTENKKSLPNSKQQQRKIPSVPYNRTFYVPKWNGAKKVNSSQQTDAINPECKSETSYDVQVDKNKVVALEDQLTRQNKELILAYKKIRDKDAEIDSLRSQCGILTPVDISVTSAQADNHSVLMQRIFVLEELVARQNKELTGLYKEIKEKQTEIVSLKTQLRAASPSHRICGNNGTNLNMMDLPEDYFELQKKANEMEAFLNEYCMTWPGENCDNRCRGEYYRPDFDHILRMIRVLNIENREPQLHYTNHGATFKTCDVYQLSFYGNGMLTEDVIFREYSDISAQRFLHDIADGFLPSELQQRYPAGVILHVEDNRNIVYKGFEEKHSVFRGQGIKLSDMRLKPKVQEQTFNIFSENIRTTLSEKYKDYSTLIQGTWNPSESQGSRCLSECEPTWTMSSDSRLNQSCQSKQKILKMCEQPKQIIKDGVIVNTSKTEKILDKDTNSRSCSTDCPEGYIKVKVRSVEGKTFLVYVQPEQSVSELKKSLAQLMNECQLLYLKDKNYVCLNDENRPLSCYGIDKNTVLLCRNTPLQ